MTSFPSSHINERLSSAVQQLLPFGRPINSLGLQLFARPIASQKGLWIRLKPQVEVKIMEEIRAVINSPTSWKTEINGTISMRFEQEVEVAEILIQLAFSKLPQKPTIFNHFSSNFVPESNSFSFYVRPSHEKVVNVCYYSALLNEPPIQATFKTRSIGNKSSFLIQLHISASIIATITQLEVHMPLSSGCQILRILTDSAQIPGVVFTAKTALVWNLLPANSSCKLKPDLALHLDLETTSPTLLVSTHALVRQSSFLNYRNVAHFFRFLLNLDFIFIK